MSSTTRFRATSAQNDSVTYPYFVQYVDGRLSQERFSSTGFLTGESKTIRDTVTPRFHARKAAGDIIMNPCKIESTKYINQGVLVSGDHSETRYYRPGSIYYPGSYTVLTSGTAVLKNDLVDTSPDPEKINYVRQQAALGVYDMAAGPIAQSLVSLAEWRKTLDLIIGLKKRAADMLIDLRRKTSQRQFDKILNHSGNAWLEYRYGWRPLLGDIDDHMKALARIIDFDRTYRTTFTSGGSDVDKSGGAYTPTGNIRIDYEDTIHRKYDCTAGLLYRFNKSILGAADRNYGLTSFGATVWELVPFSFVIDWFTNIGDWISVMENQDLITVQGSWSSTFYDCLAIRSAEGKNCGVAVSQYERVPVVNLPSYPTIDVNFDLPKAVDSFYLARGLYQRATRRS